MPNSDDMNIKYEKHEQLDNLKKALEEDKKDAMIERQEYKKPNVIGYRELTETDIAQMNVCKEAAVVVGKIISTMEGQDSIDKRWLAIAKTDLQKGFMAMVRSIAQPSTF